jgi:hypothetical protein
LFLSPLVAQADSQKELTTVKRQLLEANKARSEAEKQLVDADKAIKIYETAINKYQKGLKLLLSLLEQIKQKDPRTFDSVVISSGIHPSLQILFPNPSTIETK